jgi:hypothetical protein
MASKRPKGGKDDKDDTGSADGGRAEGELRAAPAAGSALLDGVTFRAKAVVYAAIDGLAVVEGDIVLGTVAEVRSATERAGDGGAGLESIGITGAQFRWPGATVPFRIDPGLPNQQRVTDAIAHWEARTRIRFRAATADDADFVRFVPGSGCSSMVGRRRNAQDITLGDNCRTGSVIHEIGHAVGLWHEQSREDRDQFVEIVFANIDPANQHNFLQHITDGDDIGPYDFGSIMHYPATAFSINGEPTIVPRVPIPSGVVMGQRDGLSAGDVAGVHAMYPGAVVTLKEIPKDPVRDTFKEPVGDPNKPPISDGTLKEPLKDPILDTRKEPVRDTLKEIAFDPGRSPLPGRGGVPFVLAGAGGAGDAGDAEAQTALVALVQQLSEALAAAEQERAGILAQLGEAVTALQGLQAGQG